jgi:hypothetical protein
VIDDISQNKGQTRYQRLVRNLFVQSILFDLATIGRDHTWKQMKHFPITATKQTTEAKQFTETNKETKTETQTEYFPFTEKQTEHFPVTETKKQTFPVTETKQTTTVFLPCEFAVLLLESFFCRLT